MQKKREGKSREKLGWKAWKMRAKMGCTPGHKSYYWLQQWARHKKIRNAYNL